MLLRFTAIALSLSATCVLAAESMSVRTLDGKTLTITPGDQVTVVTFISTQCPVSNDYNDRMSALYNQYSAKGVRFFFVNANSTEPASVVAEHSKSAAFPFPVYKDVDAASKLEAEMTPETFVLDKSGKQIYRGYIDDARNTARVQDHGLRNAIEAALAGKTVANPRTKALGCTIKRPRRTS